MNDHNTALPAAIASDEAALQAAKQILEDALAGYARVPHAIEQMCGYLQSMRDDLYTQLEMILAQPAQWQDMLLERILDEEQPGLYAAALAHLACLSASHSDPALDGAVQRMTAQTPAAPQHLIAVIRCFTDAVTECAFFGEGTFPCLEAQQVRRLGMVLSAAFYREWIRRCAQDDVGCFAIECADLTTMCVLAFGWAEMMCTSADSHTAKAYAHAVSTVTLANLTVDFDNWRILRSCLDSIMTQCEVFRTTLEDLCTQMELAPDAAGHLVLPEPAQAEFDTAAWLAALNYGAFEAHDPTLDAQEETNQIDNDDVTE